MSCCIRPSVQNFDYKSSSGEKIQNRMCLTCNTHWHDGKEFSREQWELMVNSKEVWRKMTAREDDAL